MAGMEAQGRKTIWVDLRVPAGGLAWPAGFERSPQARLPKRGSGAAAKEGRDARQLVNVEQPLPATAAARAASAAAAAARGRDAPRLRLALLLPPPGRGLPARALAWDGGAAAGRHLRRLRRQLLCLPGGQQRLLLLAKFVKERGLLLLGPLLLGPLRDGSAACRAVGVCGRVKVSGQCSGAWR